MRETQYAYLAGILDGEGTFKTSTKTRTFGLVVAVIDECLVEWLHATFPGTKRYRGGKTKADNPVYVWVAQKQDILVDILEGTIPYLVIKRRQAEAMLDLVNHLQAIPRYGIRTCDLSSVGRGGEERERRRLARQEWHAQAERLRVAVREARR